MDEKERNEPGRGRQAGRLTLGGAMEAVLATAIILAIFRDGWANLAEIRGIRPLRNTLVVARACDMAFSGAAIVGIVGLMLERRRGGRGSTSWGPGRWTWAYAGIYVPVVFINCLLVHITPLNWRNWLVEGVSIPNLFHIFNRYYISNTFVFGGGGMSLAVALAVAWWAGVLRDPTPDAREWSGRAFAVAILVATLLTHVADAFLL